MLGGEGKGEEDNVMLGGGGNDITKNRGGNDVMKGGGIGW